jgi:hypothetical protein
MVEQRTMTSEQMFVRLQNWIKQLIPDQYDKYDLRTKMDSSLSYEENKSIIREDLKILMRDMNSMAKEAAEQAKAQEAEMKAKQEALDKEKLKEAEKEVEQYNANLTYNDNNGLNNFYGRIIRGIKKIAQGYSNLVFVKGRGGIGKSYQIRKVLIENKAEFVEITGEVTEAYLYRLIFENNGKILWFKDVVKLLRNVGSLNLLKSATETDDARVLTKNNYSKQQEDLPDKFLCKCKFLFDYNHLFGLQLKDDFEALTTRGDYIELAYSDEDVKQILKLTAKTDTEKEVTEFLVKHFETSGMIKLNLRTQWKALRTREYAEKNALDWKQELEHELKQMSKTRAMLYTLIGTRAVRTADLKKLMLKNEMVSSLRTADRKINEWLYIEELYKWSEADKNFYVCINPKN